jgi:hypothetical protein
MYWLLLHNRLGMVVKRTYTSQVKHICSSSYHTTGCEWLLREHSHYRLNTYVAAPIVQLCRNGRAAPIVELLGNGRLENTDVTG